MLPYNPWNYDAEAGDIMVSSCGLAWRLFERKQGPNACAGILSMYPLKRKGHIAKIVNGKLKWTPAESSNAETLTQNTTRAGVH